VTLDVEPVSAPSSVSLPFGATQDVAVNLAANAVYALSQDPDTGDSTLSERAEGESAPVPIATSITNDMPQPDGTVVVHFSATTGWPLPVRQIYYQVDALDGPWSAAAPAGETAGVTLDLAPGAHEIHAFAVDGQEATLGRIQRANPVTGPVASLEVVVPAPPACANGVDDDGDTLADYPADPGCKNALGMREDPQCDNDLDDDGDLAIDYPADTRCRGAWDNDEASNPGGCGLGAELLLALGSLRRARRFVRV
jgi:hypothetical protein